MSKNDDEFYFGIILLGLFLLVFYASWKWHETFEPSKSFDLYADPKVRMK